MMGVIYSLTCVCHPEAGVRYIGQTRRGLERRLYEHLWDSSEKRKRLKDFNLPVHHWIRKHGPENIQGSIVECVPEELLDEREIYWVAYYRGISEKLLNLHGGGNSRAGWVQTEDARRKISEAGKSRLGGNRKILDVRVVPGIRKRIGAGDSYASIARDFSLPYSTVAEIADGRNYAKVNDDGVFDPSLPNRREAIRNGHSSHRVLSDSEELRARIIAGDSYSVIAKDYGVTPGAIANFVSRNGLPKRRIEITDSDKDRVVDSYTSDPSQSLRAIGRATGYSHPIVKRILVERGVLS
jgi:LysM repeat protein